MCQTDPPARIGDFDREQVASVFEGRSWGRVVTALSVLARLKLLTPARRRRTEHEASSKLQEQQQLEDPSAASEVDPTHGWVQSHARMVSGELGRFAALIDRLPFSEQSFLRFCQLCPIKNSGMY